MKKLLIILILSVQCYGANWIDPNDKSKVYSTQKACGEQCLCLDCDGPLLDSAVVKVVDGKLVEDPDLKKAKADAAKAQDDNDKKAKKDKKDSKDRLKAAKAKIDGSTLSDELKAILKDLVIAAAQD